MLPVLQNINENGQRGARNRSKKQAAVSPAMIQLETVQATNNAPTKRPAALASLG
jgi:hypothetical protein